MVVIKGRKTKVQTDVIGTVAYVSGSRILLKDDLVWRDRNAQGIWVTANNLRAR